MNELINFEIAKKIWGKKTYLPRKKNSKQTLKHTNFMII